mgnify:CR=1 FL=1
MFVNAGPLKRQLAAGKIINEPANHIWNDEE